MKKNIVLFTLIFCTVQFVSAQNSIKDIIRSFDEKLAQHSIPSAEIVIGSIHFGDTDTNGTVASWMKDEIAKAAVKTRRIKVVRGTLEMVQLETKTRGLPQSIKKPVSSYKKKYTITGKYIENKAKGIVSLTLYLETSDGEKSELFASETAIIKTSELEDFGYTLYPENIKQVESIEKDFNEAKTVIESTSLTFEDRTDTQQKTQENNQKANDSIQITGSMLDKANNFVDTLRPGDIVKFLVATDKDAYIRIMGIDAEGNTFWLPIKDNFIKANTVRIFPDDNTVDYQVLDGVFGAEHLFIYAATEASGLPNERGDAKYHPSLIATTTRGMIPVKKSEKLITGVLKIGYTVVP